MLRRQRTILKLFSAAECPVPATKLQKYVFLLRHETFVGQDPTFYDFLPYKYGPYSFAAQREIEALTAYGYLAPSGSSLALTTLGLREAMTVDSDTTHAVHTIVSKYGKKSLKPLLQDVYARYAWYARNSELQELVPDGAKEPKKAPVAVYTIGYEGRSVDGFLNKLLYTGIRRIVDVRANPVSMKYGFAKSSLSSLAAKVGIGYFHCPELGIPSSRRKQAQTDMDFQKLFNDYESQILPSQEVNAAKVAELMKATPSVLLCMEREAVNCHRGRLATRLAALNNLDVAHL
ncbi:MAG TPA: DUF488 domain-containing protein [Terracidiphilus sp.]|nr:DUF488 domain-containing protein [Terracidiphilus sp.]